MRTRYLTIIVSSLALSPVADAIAGSGSVSRRVTGKAEWYLRTPTGGIPAAGDTDDLAATGRIWAKSVVDDSNGLCICCDTVTQQDDTSPISFGLGEMPPLDTFTAGSDPQAHVSGTPDSVSRNRAIADQFSLDCAGVYTLVSVSGAGFSSQYLANTALSAISQVTIEVIETECKDCLLAPICDETACDTGLEETGCTCDFSYDTAVVIKQDGTAAAYGYVGGTFLGFTPAEITPFAPVGACNQTGLRASTRVLTAVASGAGIQAEGYVVPVLDCVFDLNLDGDIDCDDVDVLVTAIAGDPSMIFAPDLLDRLDFNGDLVVDADDLCVFQAVVEMLLGSACP